LTLPPLRDRRADIPLLAKHFMRQYLGETAPELTPEVQAALESNSWPGNVRELQNAVHRASILSKGVSPQSNHFFLAQYDRPLSEQVTVERVQGQNDSGMPLQIRSGMTVYEMERNLIIETLKATGNNRTKAADLLGISIRTLRNKLNEYKFTPSQGDGDEVSKV